MLYLQPLHFTYGTERPDVVSQAVLHIAWLVKTLFKQSVQSRLCSRPS
jgi:hypothetical protein